MNQPADSWTLAVDFGTSNTVVVIKDHNGLQPVPVEDGREFFPSVVYADEQQGLISGLTAFNMRRVQPRRYFDGAKQAVTYGDPVVAIDDRPDWPIEEVVAAVLKEAKHKAIAARAGHDSQPTRTALTHPVAWDEDQINILRRAAEIAELPAVTTFAEPVAAAFQLYERRFQPGEYIAIYDLGGGTFDAALLQRTDDAPAPGHQVPPPYRVVDTEGDRDIGGEMFDDKIVAMLNRGDLNANPAWDALQPENSPDPQDEGYAAWLGQRRTLLESLIEAKISLSTNEATAVVVPGALFGHVITRAEVESELLPDVLSTVDKFSDLIGRNGLSHNQISHVALVGGSSQIPMVRRLLIERADFDDARVTSTAFAQTVVARGAAKLIEVRGPESPAEQLFNLAEAFAAANKVKDAAAAYRKSIDCRDDQWSPRAAYRLGQLRTRNPEHKLLRKSFDTAIDAFRTAMAYKGSEWAARSALDLAGLLATINRLDEAGVYFDNAVHMNHPEVSPEAAFHLGLLHIRRGDWRSAEDAWQTAIDHNAPEWSPRAAYEMGANRKSRKNHTGARDAWRIAMSDFDHPELSPQAACLLGEMLWDKGRKTWKLTDADFQEAVDEAFQRAINSEHRDWAPRAAYQLGMAREKRRDWKGATAAHQIAVATGHPVWATKAVQRKSGIKQRG